MLQYKIYIKKLTYNNHTFKTILNIVVIKQNKIDLIIFLNYQLK